MRIEDFRRVAARYDTLPATCAAASSLAALVAWWLCVPAPGDQSDEGAIAFPILPKAQFPEIVPPTLTVTAKYPSATAETFADTVAAPLERSINGVEKAIHPRRRARAVR